MTEITQVKLDEMLAGLEGLPGGEWYYDVPDPGYTYDFVKTRHPDFAPTPQSRFRNQIAETDGTTLETQRIGKHIARCDPDTMRAIIALASQALRSQGEAVRVQGAGVVTVDGMQATICEALLNAYPMADKIADNYAAVAAKAVFVNTHPAPQEAGEVKVKPDDNVILQSLGLMTALVKLKYGNLDADIWQEIQQAEAIIATLTEGSSR